jgi:4a-hydroxytetrahydrobiopterin dehydratase
MGGQGIMELAQKMCLPCEGGAPALRPERIAELLVQIPDWKTSENLGMLSRRYGFADFVATMAFVNQIAALAEEQGHHPDFCVHYDMLDVQLTTHAIGGLSENDFIMAAKIEALASSSSR